MRSAGSTACTRSRSPLLADEGALEHDAQALWSHVTYLIETKPDTPVAELDGVATAVAGGGEQGPTTGLLGLIAVRIALSCAVGYEPVTANLAAAVARLSGVHTVVWAAVVDLDRRLLRLRHEEAASLRELERQMEGTMETYRHVRAVRADLETISVHLDAVDRPLWDAYAGVWGLHTQLRSLDVKLESQEHVLAHATATLNNRRSRVLSTLALPFTVASIIGVAGGVIDLSSKRLAAPAGANLWLVGGLVALAIALWLVLTSVVLRSAERPSR